LGVGQEEILRGEWARREQALAERNGLPLSVLFRARCHQGFANLEFFRFSQLTTPQGEILTLCLTPHIPPCSLQLAALLNQYSSAMEQTDLAIIRRGQQFQRSTSMSPTLLERACFQASLNGIGSQNSAHPAS
jgi:hypothetical protein